MIVVRRCLALALLWVAAPLAAQDTTPSAGGTQRAPTDSASKPAAPTPSLNFSGVLFGNFNYQLPTTPAQLPSQINEAFIVGRAYLNFRMAAGDRTSIRITTDVYQTQDSVSNAYTVRAKYAYLQYEAPKRANGAQVTGRVGILQNVVIDHIDLFYPRYLAQAPTERAGYFASADVGVAGLFTLPKKWGEVFAEIVNGPGYTSLEKDRFKDYAVRLTLTPLMNRSTSPLLESFTITAWGYKGALASKFVNGGTGQVGAVGESLDRSRAGVFVGFRDPNLVIAGELTRQTTGGETGANTVQSPRVANTTTGRLLSGITLVRPFAFSSENRKSPFGLVGRYDHVKPSVSSTGFATPPPSANAYHFLIAGPVLRCVAEGNTGARLSGGARVEQ
jgi:hypothetical protein